jgi:hypothetical protein
VYLDNFNRNTLFGSVGLGNGPNYTSECYGCTLFWLKTAAGIGATSLLVPISLVQNLNRKMQHKLVATYNLVIKSSSQLESSLQGYMYIAFSVLIKVVGLSITHRPKTT